MAPIFSKKDVKNIKKLLIDYELSQDEVARRLNYSREHVCTMLNGKYPPSKKILDFIDQLKHSKKAA